MTNDWYDSETGKTGCGSGWDAILFPLIDLAKAEGVPIFQIKEKFGGLRFYTDGSESETLKAAIDAAEDACSKTCERCGQPGELRTNRSWLKTLCDVHAKEEI